MSNENKPHKSDIIFKSIKTIIILAALFIAYLFALNGRYSVINDKYMIFFDNWTKTVIEITDIKTMH